MGGAPGRRRFLPQLRPALHGREANSGGRTNLEKFTRRFVEKAREYTCGDPFDPETRIGTVIDEAAAIYLEEVVHKAVAAGAKVLLGGDRKGALLPPTVIATVPRDAEIIVCESFGPLAPIVAVRDLE